MEPGVWLACCHSTLISGSLEEDAEVTIVNTGSAL